MTKFRQHDLTRALKGAIAAGVQITRVEIDPSGKIMIQLGSGERVEPSNEFDKWLADHAHQA